MAFEHECFAVRYIPSATEQCHPQKLAGLALVFFLTVQEPAVFLHLCLKACSKLHRVPAVLSTIRHGRNRLSRDTTGVLRGALLEAVLELAVDGLQVLHAAGAGGLSSLGLLAPVVCEKMY